jgi:hypothetical protein
MDILGISMLLLLIVGIILVTVRAGKKPKTPMGEQSRERDQIRNGVDPKEQ